MDYGNFMVDRLHTVVAATTDDEGLPVTCAIDIMDSDAGGLYFLTAKGKGLYHRLKSRSYMAFTGVNGRDTLSSVAVSARGKVRERACEAACPQRCIDFSARPAVIRQEHCLRCGNCQAVCQQGAVFREG